jgi:hypothetical protein
VVLAFWSWSGWNALVSIGTLALAAGTGALAWFTWRAVRESRASIKLQRDELDLIEQQTNAVRTQAQATERQVALSAAAMASTARPVLVGLVSPATFSPVEEAMSKLMDPVVFPGGHLAAIGVHAVHYEEVDGMLYFSACVRNIGAGVAFVQRVALLTRTAYPVRISPPIIPPGETARVLVALTLKQSDGSFTDVNEVTRTGRGFVRATLGLFYTGASPDLALTTEFTVSELPDDQGWLITGTRIWDGDTKADTSEPEGPALLASTDNIG